MLLSLFFFSEARLYEIFFAIPMQDKASDECDTERKQYKAKQEFSEQKLIDGWIKVQVQCIPHRFEAICRDGTWNDVNDKNGNES